MSTVAEQIAEIESNLKITEAIIAQVPEDIEELLMSEDVGALGTVMTADAGYRQALASLTLTQHMFDDLDGPQLA